MHDVQIFTTPILDGLPIKEYRGFVSAKNVRAVNFLRDFLTTFRDIFGGKSESYLEVMDEVQYELIEEIKQQARAVGANAIVGFQLDFENIGSKGKSLLMAFGKGTAVVI